MDASDRVTLSAHDSLWAESFATEANVIRAALGSNVVSIEHIGSTAVPGLVAKPIIDVLVAVSSLDAVDVSNAAMMAQDYEPMGAFGIAGRRYFRKSTGGVRAYHVHVFTGGDAHLTRHVALRDYLIAHPDRATAYAELKRSLGAASTATRASYVEGKDAFVKATEALALRWLRDTSR